MNKQEVIKQLRRLKEFFSSFEERFKEDVQALDYAIKELERTAPEVPVQEQYVSESSSQVYANTIRNGIINSISKEKLEWMKEVEMQEFEEPMKYYIGCYKFLYSEKYIRETPLSILKRRYRRRVSRRKFKTKLEYNAFKFFYIVKKFIKVIFESVFHIGNSRCR